MDDKFNISVTYLTEQSWSHLHVLLKKNTWMVGILQIAIGANLLHNSFSESGAKTTQLACANKQRYQRV